MSIVGTLLFHRNTEYWAVLLDEERPEVDTMVEDLTTFIMGGLQYNGK